MSKENSMTDLYEDNEVDSTEEEVDSTEVKKNVENPKKKPSKKSKVKIDSTEEEVDSTNKVPIVTEHHLEIDDLWKELCDLRGSYGITSLLCLLTGKSGQSAAQLSKDKTQFKRAVAAEGVMKLFRHLKGKGYI